MKSLSNFVIESRGQAIINRESNRPYDPKEDDLVKSKNTRQLKAKINRINEGLAELSKFVNDDDSRILFKELVFGFAGHIKSTLFTIKPLGRNRIELSYVTQPHGHIKTNEYMTNVKWHPFDISFKLEDIDDYMYRDGKKVTFVKPAVTLYCGNKQLTSVCDDIDGYEDSVDDFLWIFDEAYNDQDQMRIYFMIDPKYANRSKAKKSDDSWTSKYAESLSKMYGGDFKTGSNFIVVNKPYDVMVPLHQFNFEKFLKAQENVDSKFWESMEDDETVLVD